MIKKKHFEVGKNVVIYILGNFAPPPQANTLAPAPAIYLIILLPELGWYRWKVSIARLAPLSWYTEIQAMSYVQSWNLYKGWVFDQILKANFKTDEKFWGNAQ